MTTPKSAEERARAERNGTSYPSEVELIAAAIRARKGGAQ